MTRSFFGSKCGKGTTFAFSRFVGGISLPDGRCLIGSEGTGFELEIFDPTTETFSTVPTLPGYENENNFMVLMNMLPDGIVPLSADPALIFDPATNQVTEISRPPEFIAGEISTSASLADGRVLIAATNNNSLSNSAVLFVPSVPPTANAGPDQSIRLGETVALDGTGSFDDKTSTASLVYSWSFLTKPNGSVAELDDAASPTPTFVADLAGTYVVELTVSDIDGLISPVDQVEISSKNLAPTAVATVDFGVTIVGGTVHFDGSESFDPEDDPLKFAWTITAAPNERAAALVDNQTPSPNLTPDLEGEYEISLTVSDPLGEGEPATIQVLAVDPVSYAEILIVNASDYVAGLADNQVTKPGNRRALGKIFRRALKRISKGNYERAIVKLTRAIKRTDGCVLRGSPDGRGRKRDWIIDCEAQEVVYNLLTDAVEALLDA